VILGKKLLELLKEKGSLEAMEVQVKRWQRTTVDNDVGGRWITKKQLVDNHSYTPSLVLYDWI